MIGAKGRRVFSWVSGGIDPIVKVVVARLEVARAVANRTESQAIPDALRTTDFPSITTDASDRVLAEFDQDGFVVARDPRDALVHSRRDASIRRKKAYYPLTIVLKGGRIYLCKRFGRPGLREGFRKWLSGLLGVNFYNEVAALLRLQGALLAPTPHIIDLTNRAIYMDCIKGQTLKHRLAQCGVLLFDLDLDAHPELRRLTRHERTEREFAMFAVLAAEDTLDGEPLRARIAAVVERINRLGVSVADLKLEHIIVGEHTAQLYWVDLEWARLESHPRWHSHLQEQWSQLHRVFGVQPRVS